MSTIAKLSGTDFDRMVQRGAFLDLQSLKIELIHGELRFMNPAGPGQRVHVHRDPGKTRYHSVVIVEKTGFILRYASARQNCRYTSCLISTPKDWPTQLWPM